MKMVNNTKIVNNYVDLGYSSMINGLFDSNIENNYVDLTNLLISLNNIIRELKDNSARIKEINKEIETLNSVNGILRDDEEKSNKEILNITLSANRDKSKLFHTFRDTESKKNVFRERIKHSNEIVNATNNDLYRLNEEKRKLISESKRISILFSNYIKDIITLLSKINVDLLNLNNKDLKINKLEYINNTNLSEVKKSKIRRYITINYSLRIKCFNMINELSEDIVNYYTNQDFEKIDSILNSNKFNLIIDILVNNNLTKFNSIEDISNYSRRDFEFDINHRILNYINGDINVDYDEYINKLYSILKLNNDKDIFKTMSLFIKYITDDKKEMLKHESSPKR